MTVHLDTVAKVKCLVFPLCLLPLVLLGFDIIDNALGPDPATSLTRVLGEWGLRFLCLTLAITPLRKITGINKLIRFRRMLGLFSLFYALLHASSYLAFMLGGDWGTLLEDLYQRPYIIVGAFSLLILVVLGVTSTKKQVRRLGKHWSKLHKFVYLSVLMALVHFIWLVKSDYVEPAFYSGIVIILLLLRWPALTKIKYK